jgi:hypothetical protein
MVVWAVLVENWSSGRGEQECSKRSRVGRQAGRDSVDRVERMTIRSGTRDLASLDGVEQ